LGSDNGIKDIKSHEFFQQVVWDRVIEKNHRMPPVKANEVFQMKPNDAIQFERYLKVSTQHGKRFSDKDNTSK